MKQKNNLLAQSRNISQTNLLRTVKFYTLGCKVNQYETQLIREQFQRANFKELTDGALADVCIINTCTVTHRADRSSLNLIRREFRSNPNSIIIVTGCLTEFDTDKINNIAGVSLIVKNKQKNTIIPLLYKNFKKLFCEKAKLASSSLSNITYFKDHSRAFLKIQDGCDYNCSYCKVRLVRGKSHSRKPGEIKQEIANLIKNGYSEIVLSGICLGSYGRDLSPRSTLTRLIKRLEKIPGNFRIRLSSIEANDINAGLINMIKESNRICHHLHIPVQSGSDKILKMMNRAYSADKYINIISQIKRSIPDIAITTDVMVGFPGETEQDFNNTVNFIKKIKPSRMHIFPYSRRYKTLAYNLRDFVVDKDIRSRMAVLQGLNRSLGLSYCNRFVSRPGNVLLETRVVGHFDLWEGYTDNYIRVRVKCSEDLRNQIISVRLKRIYNNFVFADILH